MKKEKRFLAFDIGAETGRAIVGIIDTDQITLNEIYRFPNGGVSINNHLHWNVLGLYTQLLEGLKIYVREYGPDLNGIGVDTWGVDFGLFDSKGNLIGNPYHYRDDRNKGTPEIIDKKVGNEEIYNLTGIQLLPFNTVNQLVSMVESHDPALNITEKILFMADILHYFLTGEMAVEYTAASISQLYNTAMGKWEKSIFEKLNIPYHLTAKIIRAGDIIGYLKKNIANEVGLGRIPVIAPAVHDTASAAVAIPTTEESGWAFLSSGTWSIVGLEVEKPIITKKSRELNISNSGGAAGKILYLKNIMGLWIIQCCRKLWHQTDHSIDYPEIVAMSDEAKPFVSFIDPDDLCFLNPDNAPQQILDFCKRTNQKIPQPDDIGLISRIVFESLALKFRYVLDRLVESTGKEVNTLHITGGGCKNETLNQFTSNALGKKVFAGPVEATAIGNIMVQSIGAGLYSSLGEIRRVIKNSFNIKEYLPQHEDSWNAAYDRFRKIIN
jgi:rhamnulokinase